MEKLLYHGGSHIIPSPEGLSILGKDFTSPPQGSKLRDGLRIGYGVPTAMDMTIPISLI